MKFMPASLKDVYKRQLQRRVVDDFVVRQRLFDHHQVEFVQVLQVLTIG